MMSKLPKFKRFDVQEEEGTVKVVAFDEAGSRMNGNILLLSAEKWPSFKRAYAQLEVIFSGDSPCEATDPEITRTDPKPIETKFVAKPKPAPPAPMGMGGRVPTANKQVTPSVLRKIGFDALAFNQGIGEYSAEEVRRVIEYHWTVGSNTWWRENVTSESFLIKQFPKMLDQFPANYGSKPEKKLPPDLAKRLEWYLSQGTTR